MHDITKSLRLAVGSHAAGTGKGCAMNLISWENGDTTITDLPDCTDPVLARIVQRVNDTICDHRDGDLLCPDCSIVVLGLAHRTVGTGTLPLTRHERHVVWVKTAIDQARQVKHLVPADWKVRASRALDAAQAWIENPCEEASGNAAAAASAAYASYDAHAAYAAYAAAASAAYAAYDAHDASAYYDASAAYAAYDAHDASASAQTAAHLSLANRAIDLFQQLTQHVQAEVTDEQVAAAYARMTTTP